MFVFLGSVAVLYQYMGISMKLWWIYTRTQIYSLLNSFRKVGRSFQSGVGEEGGYWKMERGKWNLNEGEEEREWGELCGCWKIFGSRDFKRFPSENFRFLICMCENVYFFKIWKNVLKFIWYKIGTAGFQLQKVQ